MLNQPSSLKHSKWSLVSALQFTLFLVRQDTKLGHQ
jgi:hypothetical protein